MTCIIDEYYSIGKPLVYWPLVEGNLLADTQGAVDLVDGDTLGTAAGPFAGQNVGAFNGTTHDIAAPNFSDIFAGRSGFSGICWVYFDATAGANQYIHYMADPSVAICETYLKTSTTVLRNYTRAKTTDASSFREVDSDIAAWYPLLINCFPNYNVKGAASNLAAGIDVDLGVFTPAAEFMDWGTGRSMRLGGLGARMTGRLAHVVFWERIIGQDEFEDRMDAATTGGVWCTVDLAAAGVYKIDSTEIVTDTLDYWLYSDSDETRLYSQGTDFDIASSVATNKFFLPTAANDYFLVLRDPATGKAHAQTVPVTAV